MSNKLTSLAETVELLRPGMTLALGGMTLYRRPVAWVRALLACPAPPDDLTLMSFTSSYESDLLVGAGLVRRVRTCYFGFEIFGFAPHFTRAAQAGTLEIVEETEASLAFGLKATLSNVGFMPGRGWLGTDMLKLRPDVQTIRDPYSGEEYVAFPALRPDVAVIHALEADVTGNARIGQNPGVDVELALAAPIVILTAEVIVPQLTQADILAPVVTAVVHAPHGAWPTSCHPLYPLDGEAILAYLEKANEQ